MPECVKNAGATIAGRERRRDEKETRGSAGGEREDRTYSGKVELGCNGGWLGWVVTVAARKTRERRERVRRKMEGPKGGW